MKVFITGVNGQLGHDVLSELCRRGKGSIIGSDIGPEYTGFDSRMPADSGTAATSDNTATADSRMPVGNPDIPVSYRQLDITNAQAVAQVLQELRPDAVVHCAAWTAVDLAEEPENQKKVYAINAAGTRYLAEQCKALGCRMMYISTDYVFDGQGTEPWQPDCTDYHPLNYYGRTKLAGEQAVKELLTQYYIVRIAWVFGTNGNNFIRTMLKIGKNHDRLTVVNDQIGTPTYTHDLARLLADMLETDKYGTYHATNEGGYISWYDFACEIFRQAAALSHPEYAADRLTVIPVTTAEYGLSKAARPFNSRLDRSKLDRRGFTPLPDWKDALARYLQEITI